MTTAKALESELLLLANAKKAADLSRFFKCGPGEYGEGDRFLGIPVPQTRTVLKLFTEDLEPTDVEELTASEWHEVRLAGFLALVAMYTRATKRRDADEQRRLVELYLKLIPRGNNWDLVDLVAPKILGHHALTNPEAREILHTLAAREDLLWVQRVGIVATWKLIQGGCYDDAIAICRKLLSHRHDLIHKATGWMLREVGKRGGEQELIAFLDEYAHVMPRTMLRYAIEKLPLDLRRHYMAQKRVASVARR